jgi:predicted nicotinamide N-methyase
MNDGKAVPRKMTRILISPPILRYLLVARLLFRPASCAIAFSSMSNHPATDIVAANRRATPRFILQVDQATTLSTGTTFLPPMVSVPCYVADNHAPPGALNGESPPEAVPLLSTIPTSCDGGGGSLRELIKPPNVDDLYEWYVNVRRTPDADPTWGVVWPAAVALTDYLLSRPGLLSRERRRRRRRRLLPDEATEPDDGHVVELGAGVALCGLAAAIEVGAPLVTVTDREPFALHCALATAACNPDRVRIGGGNDSSGDADDNHNKPVLSAALLDWRQVEQSAPQLVDSATVILASDVLYDGTTIDAFAEACLKILKKKAGTSSNATTAVIDEGCMVLVADPKVERFVGAREMLLQSRLAGAARGVHVLDLPIPSLPSSPDPETLDGVDHRKRMQEPSVLMQFTF